jgi:hypothetical protein
MQDKNYTTRKTDALKTPEEFEAVSRQLLADVQSMPTIRAQMPIRIGPHTLLTLSSPCWTCGAAVSDLRGEVIQETDRRVAVNAVGLCACGGRTGQTFRYHAIGDRLLVERESNGKVIREDASMTRFKARTWWRLPIWPWAGLAVAAGVLVPDQALFASLGVMLAGGVWTSWLLYQSSNA